MKGILKKYVDEVVSELFSGVSTDGVSVDLSENFGDYATNVALVLSKKVGKNPWEIAEAITEKLRERNIPDVEKIEIAGPGFINFYLKMCIRDR